MSNYNELKLTYQGGRQETITLTSSTIEFGEYQRHDIVSVEVPEIVQTIGGYAFCDNNDLANIVLNEGLRIIEGQAFQHGVYTAVTIPSTITEICENSFNTIDEQRQDHHTFTVTCLASRPPRLEDPEGRTFGSPDLLTIYVPATSVEDYKREWPDYADKIQAIPTPQPSSGFSTLDITAAYVGDTEVTRLYLGNNLVYQVEKEDMLRTPLTFKFIEQGTGTTHGIGLRLTGVTSTAERDQYRHPVMYVLTHNELKTTGYFDLTEDVSSSAVTSFISGLTPGDTVELYAKEKQGTLGSTVNIYEYFVLYDGGDKYAVYGNVNSLLVTKDEFDDFDNATFIASAYTFHGLFFGKTNCDFGAPSSEKHILLAEPTNGLQDSCYMSMFYGCTSLTSAPTTLPATSLADYCYSTMFMYCTSLTTAPELPATSLADYCYADMFYGCTRLNYIKCLATDISASNCTSRWVNGVSATGTFVKDPNMTSWRRGINAIPTKWTVLDAVGIQLPVTYENIWEDESGMKTIAILPFEDWTASTSDNWITFDKATGTSEDRTFSFNYASTNEPRTGTITFTSNSNSVTFTLYQNDLNKRLTFNILSDGLITWKKTEKAAASRWNVSLYYRKNDATSWSTLTISSGGSSINVSAGDTLEFAAYTTRPTLAADLTMYCWLGDSTAQFEARGNIMSLLSSNDYSGATTLEGTYTFYGLFSGCTGLTSAEKMKLPATTLAANCYDRMFYGCTSLTSAPELPATTLTSYCYRYMFQGCRSLTQAPELPATTLAEGCYQYMFNSCTNLNYIKCLAITSGGCYYWVYGVSPTGTFVKNPNMTSWPTGENGIPTGWDVVDATE